MKTSANLELQIYIQESKSENYDLLTPYVLIIGAR